MVRLSWLLLAAALAVNPKLSADDGSEFFQEQVEPLLRKHCYECHAHTAREMQAGLALDWRNGWATGGERGPAIVPGEPDQSLLIQAIRHSDPELQMPEKKLPATDIAVLVDWVARGAPDPRVARPETAAAGKPDDWWSLKPLRKPEIPAVDSEHPVDAFLEAQRRKRNLASSPEADRRTLIRRVFFDLLGLPPTLEETAAFEDSTDPRAWERLVDQLLARPHYGERWARHWLDTIHFADTHGFEHDVLRPNAWRYRDYVIDSLNQDTPWPRFIREQLAADLFFPDDPRLTVALGFLGAGPYDQSAAGTAPQSFEYLDRDDLVTQTMAAFVSTTANCARCHAHKFDPITQEDYYALQAVFAGVGKGDVTFDEDAAVARERRRWVAIQAGAERGDRSLLLTPEIDDLVVEWETQRGGTAAWQPLEVEVFISSEEAVLQRQSDGSILSTGPRPEMDRVTVVAAAPLREVTALRLEVLTDDSLPLKGPGRTDNGNLHLSEIELQIYRAQAGQPEKLKFHHASADFEQAGWTSGHAIDGDPKTAWGIHPRVGESHQAVFELDTRLVVGAGDRLVVLLKQLHGGGHVIGRFRLSVTDAPASATMALPLAVETALAVPPEQRTEEQRLILASLVSTRRAADELKKLPVPAKVFAAASSAENERGLITYSEPRVIRLLKRGDLSQPGDEIGPGALSAVSSLPSRFDVSEAHGEAARRAALADWIADPNNPLTWRSIANRVWHYHFGRGLCDTPSDFGRMGGEPSHPELLDWLACELRDQGGSLKHLHRLICTSNAYRQSSAHRDDAAALDPENRLLWRMNCRRLDADSYRDTVLAISGRLDRTAGGPGVAYFRTSPGPQITPKLDYSGFDWSGPGVSRRSIYRVVWRGIPDPFMEALDFPDAALLAPTRGFSASPLQALTLLNNEFVLQHSRALAERVTQSAGTVAGQIREAVRLSLLREPSAEEYAEFTTLAEKHGLAAVCRLLLNANEFLFVE